MTNGQVSQNPKPNWVTKVSGFVAASPAGPIESGRHIDLAKENLEEASLVVKLPILVQNWNESDRG